MGIAVIPAFPDWLSIAVNPASIQVYTAIPAWPPFAVFAQKARFAVYAVPDLLLHLRHAVIALPGLQHPRLPCCFCNS